MVECFMDMNAETFQSRLNWVCGSKQAFQFSSLFPSFHSGTEYWFIGEFSSLLIGNELPAHMYPSAWNNTIVDEQASY